MFMYSVSGQFTFHVIRSIMASLLFNYLLCFTYLQFEFYIKEYKILKLTNNLKKVLIKFAVFSLLTKFDIFTHTALYLGQANCAFLNLGNS